MKYELIILLILLGLIVFVWQGTEKIDPKVEAEFSYRYQN